MVREGGLLRKNEKSEMDKDNYKLSSSLCFLKKSPSFVKD